MRTIIYEQIFDADTPLTDLEAACEQRLRFGALDCRVEKLDNGEFALITVRPGPEMIRERGGAPAEKVAESDASHAIATAEHSIPLGELSKKYESKGKPDAVGRDKTGGPSYGTYQIATKTGTMASFLKFLARVEPDFAHALNDAGGAAGALAESPDFVSAWKNLADDDDFVTVQHAFIKSTHYDPFVEKTKAELELDLDLRSDALKNVAWSTAVQHGPGCRVFSNALLRSQLSEMSDAEIITAVYAERAKVNRYFSRSTPEVQEAVKERFADECQDALALLA